MANAPDLQIDFMAHSMGSRILLNFVSDAHDKIGPSVTFAAADVDAEEFKKSLYPAGVPLTFANSGFPTLYASSFDFALLISQVAHLGSRRAGSGGDDTLVVPGLDSIDVNVPFYSTLGHSYVFDHSYPLRDFEALINTRLKAAQRGLLAVRKRDGTYFFRINP